MIPAWSPFPLAAVLAGAGLLVSCADQPSPTVVRLALSYDEAWELTELEVRIGEQQRRASVVHELAVVLPEDRAGMPTDIEIDGLRGDGVYASAIVTVTPALRAEVHVEVELGPMACGDGPGIACEPPPSECVDGLTERTYAVGTCRDGVCDQPFEDVTCPWGCAGGACRVCEPDTWIPATMGSGQYPRLAADGGGTVHLLYHDGADLKYAYRSVAAPFSFETVSSSVTAEGRRGLAVDDAGGVHVTFQDGATTGLSYAFRSPAGGWMTSAVDPAADQGAESSIALDASGGVHVAYYDATAAALDYAYSPTGISWTTSLVDAAGMVGWFPSVAVDATGGVHVSYHDGTNFDLKYAYRLAAGPTWTVMAADPAGNTGWFSSLALDPSGGVHVGYTDLFDLRHAYKPVGGGWTTTRVPSEGIIGLYSALAVDGAGGVHLSYYDEMATSIGYAYQAPGELWTTATVAPIEAPGQRTAIAVDGSGNVHLSYYDGESYELTYAYKGACL